MRSPGNGSGASASVGAARRVVAVTSVDAAHPVDRDLLDEQLALDQILVDEHVGVGGGALVFVHAPIVPVTTPNSGTWCSGRRRGAGLPGDGEGGDLVESCRHLQRAAAGHGVGCRTLEDALHR